MANEEEKVTAEGEVNTGQKEEQMDTGEMIDKEIEQFHHYLKEYMGIEPEVFDKHLDKEDYVKMIVEGLYNQYVARMMEQQQKMQQQQQQQQQQESKIKTPDQL